MHNGAEKTSNLMMLTIGKCIVMLGMRGTGFVLVHWRWCSVITPQKKFDEKDYIKNEMAYEALKRHFSFLFPVLREEDFGVDVAVYNGERAYHKKAEPLCYLEIESKSNWKGRDFPRYFPDVQFLAKKQRFIRMDKPVYWVLFNDDCTNAGIINFRKIMTCELDVVYCKQDSIGYDFFYRIPRNEMVWGIEHIERFLIQDAFQTMQQIHKLSVG